MRILNEEHFQNVKRYAESIGDTSLQNCLDRLKKWEENPDPVSYTHLEVADKHITVLATIKDSMEEVFCQSPFELGASNIDWLNQMYEAVRLQLENTKGNS